jgi:hypothetical protein
MVLDYPSIHYGKDIVRPHMSITDLTPQQLREAADLQEKIQELQDQLNAFLHGVKTPVLVAIEAPLAAEPGKSRKGRRKFSAETRAKMAAAQQARWAVKKGEKEETPSGITGAEAEGKPKKRKVSAAGKAAIAAAAKARWARVRAEKGTANDEPKVKKMLSRVSSKAKSQAAKVMWAKRRAAKTKKLDETMPF